jgi:hypothetical protein
MIGPARAPSNGKAGCRLPELAAATHPPVEFLQQPGLRDLEHGPGIGIPDLDSTGAERAVRRRTALNAGDGRRWLPGTRLSTDGEWRLDQARLSALTLCAPGSGTRHPSRSDATPTIAARALLPDLAVVATRPGNQLRQREGKKT